MTTIAGTKYVIIGTGILGLSTADHLALQLKATGKGSGDGILVVDKSANGGGASGIARGAVRNNYYRLGRLIWLRGRHGIVTWSPQISDEKQRLRSAQPRQVVWDFWQK